MKTKKGELTWEMIGRLLIGLLVLVVMLIIIFASKEQMATLAIKIKSLLRFGG